MSEAYTFRSLVGTKMENKIKQRCPTCGHIIEQREIAMFDGMIRALHTVYRWCLEKNRHEFTRKDIKHLFINENEIARFGDWVMFGGIVYRPLINGKPKKGHYGINITRSREFFSGFYKIPARIWKSPDGTLHPEDYRSLKEMPRLYELLNTDLEYSVNYKPVDKSVDDKQLKMI